jgi:hypothetical protein
MNRGSKGNCRGRGEYRGEYRGSRGDYRGKGDYRGRGGFIGDDIEE